MSDTEDKAFLKKMRIQLFDPQMNQLEDRLVHQDTELRKGPRTTHTGPIKLEVCLFQQADISEFKNYLDTLLGSLPLEEKRKTIKNLIALPEDPSFRETLIEQVLELDSQDAIAKFLREKGFVFVTAEHLHDIDLAPEFKDPSHQEFQWMILKLKEAKSPVNDKYDPLLLFGMKLLGTKVDTLLIYSHRKLQGEYEKTWKKANKLTFKNTDMAKFPVYMIAEEREKFRNELYKLRKDPELRSSKFFNRWMPDVIFKEKDEWLNRE